MIEIALVTRVATHAPIIALCAPDPEGEAAFEHGFPDAPFTGADSANLPRTTYEISVDDVVHEGYHEGRGWLDHWVMEEDPEGTNPKVGIVHLGRLDRAYITRLHGATWTYTDAATGDVWRIYCHLSVRGSGGITPAPPGGALRKRRNFFITAQRLP